jgi:hypothetical protein
MTKTYAALAALAAFALPAQAAENSPLRNYVADHVTAWAEAPEIVDAIKAQNAANANLTQEQIDALDKAWRAEVGAADTPTIKPVITNALSDFLRQRVAASDGAIVELFVMDDKGMLVGTSAVTSDYWQGDEDKWQKSYAMGPGAVDEGAIEFDDSAQIYEGQVSITITDPASGAAIGAMTIGLDSQVAM